VRERHERQGCNGRASAVASPAFGDSRICQKRGRNGKGIPGVCHRPQCFRRGHAGRSSPLNPLHSSGFAGDSQRSPGCLSGPAASRAKPPREGVAHAARGGLQPRRAEVLTAAAQFSRYRQTAPTEAGFYGVKIFSLAFCLFSAAVPACRLPNASPPNL
jgi:hypothetical protein